MGAFTADFGMMAVHMWERDQRQVGLRTHQTSVEDLLADILLAQVMPEAPPAGLEESLGNPTVVRLERVAVVTGVGIEEAFRDTEQGVADSTVALEWAGVCQPTAAVEFHQYFRVVLGLQGAVVPYELAQADRRPPEEQQLVQEGVAQAANMMVSLFEAEPHKWCALGVEAGESG